MMTYSTSSRSRQLVRRPHVLRPCVLPPVRRPGLLLSISTIVWMRAICCFFFFSSRRRHTRLQGDWSSDVCSSDLVDVGQGGSGVLVPRGRAVAASQVRPGRAGAAGRARAARLLVRGRRVRALGGPAPAHRGRVGEGRELGSGGVRNPRPPGGRRPHLYCPAALGGRGGR